MATMIKAEHLTFCYPDEPADHPPVLDDINLEIEAGSFVAILGHNGSGKSTLAKHMNALLTPTGAWIPQTRKISWLSAARSGWSFKTRTTRLSPAWSRKT